MEYIFPLIILCCCVGVWALLRNKSTLCDHHNVEYTFKDFHRGGDGEMYHRVYMLCEDCAWKKCMAIRLPDHITHTLDNTPNFTWYVQ